MILRRLGKRCACVVVNTFLELETLTLFPGAFPIVMVRVKILGFRLGLSVVYIF